jgi:spore coat-associated protein N
MQRIDRLWAASPRRVLIAAATALLALAVAVGSGANFNSTTANPSNVFTAGTLTSTNSKDGGFILTATGMRPGDSQAGTVDIKNTGSLSGTFTLAKSALTDAPASPAFSSKLDLLVEDLGDCTSGCTATPSTVYTGKVGAMPSQSLAFAAGAVHRYRFTVSFPNGGSGGADNAYQGASTSVRYDWELAS